MRFGSCWSGTTRALSLAVLTGLFMLPVARAADPGTIVGLVTDAAHAPVAHATVTAIRASDHAIRATISGIDGTYAFADLPPGSWSVSWEAPGYQEASLAAIEVSSGKAARRDVTLSATGAARQRQPSPARPSLLPPRRPGRPSRLPRRCR